MRVVNCLTDGRIGGPQRRSLAVARLLRERGIETTFLFPTGFDEFEELARDEGFRVRRPDVPRLRPPRDVGANARYAATFPRAVRRIRSHVEAVDPDLLHVNMSVNFRAALAGRLSDADLIWHLNDMNVPAPLDRGVARAARALADTIVVSSDCVTEHYYPDGDVETEVIYPPVDTDEFRPDRTFHEGTPLREELGVDPSTPIVGTVGNVNPAKGYRHLLRAVRRVVDGYGRVVVPIAGAILDTQREYYDSLRRLRSELGLEDVVQFLGKRSDVPRLLSQFDVFVVSSVTETGPMTLMEAMAMEKPVVTTNVGVVPEQFEHGTHGLVVPPGDAERLGRALREMLTSRSDWDRYGADARERADRAFSVDRIADRHEEVYRSTVGRPVAPPSPAGR